MRNYVDVGLRAQGPEPKPEKEPIECFGWQPEVGDRRTFRPAAFDQEHAGGSVQSVKPTVETVVTGTVVYVNKAHRWCRVRYETASGPQHECFKF